MAFAILRLVMIRVLLCAFIVGCGTTPPPSSPPPPGGNPAPPGSNGTPTPTPTPTSAPPFFAFREFSGFTAGANGALISPVVPVQQPFREAVASWNADTPSGSWIEIDLRARIGGNWTTDYVMGIWTSQ